MKFWVGLGMDKNKIRGVSNYADPHLEHRRLQESFCSDQSESLATPLKSILTIELNITELCNRKCVFCPRVDPNIYPNRNLNMDISIIEKLVEEVGNYGIFPRFSFSGFGEPVLHKQLTKFVQVINTKLPQHTIEINTNGDRLTPVLITGLFDAGLTYLYVNLYDWPEQIPHFENLMKVANVDPARFHLRPHWTGGDSDFGLALNNRAGSVNSPTINLFPLSEKIDRRCNYPFYKLLLDWNGDVIFCSNDWGREKIIANFSQLSLSEIWLHPEFVDIRKRLVVGDRGCSPCNKCNVNGLITGNESVNVLMKHYLKEEIIQASEIPTDLHSKIFE